LFKSLNFSIFVSESFLKNLPFVFTLHKFSIDQLKSCDQGEFHLLFEF
jgi:hypothetical protein